MVRVSPAQFALFAEQVSPRTKSAGRAAGGSKANAAGKSFEEIIKASCTDSQGRICRLTTIKNFAQRIPNKNRRAGDPGFIVVAMKSPFDFAGTICATGRAIFIDSKSFDSASFPLNDKKMVKPHQIKALLEQEQAGAVAGFLIRSMRTRMYYFLWASAAANRCHERMQWYDLAFDVLGPVQDGCLVPMRKLVGLS